MERVDAMRRELGVYEMVGKTRPGHGRAGERLPLKAGGGLTVKTRPGHGRARKDLALKARSALATNTPGAP